MSAPEERPEVAPFADPVDRVHHHQWNPVAGNLEVGFCGARVIALTPQHASSLPCCPMCALVLEERGWNCVAEGVA